MIDGDLIGPTMRKDDRRPRFRKVMFNKRCALWSSLSTRKCVTALLIGQQSVVYTRERTYQIINLHLFPEGLPEINPESRFSNRRAGCTPAGFEGWRQIILPRLISVSLVPIDITISYPIVMFIQFSFQLFTCSRRHQHAEQIVSRVFITTAEDIGE
jgi:hypothetical protein